MLEILKKIIYSETEKDFLKNIASGLDDLIKFKNVLLEMFDGTGFLMSLKKLDKEVLDKKYGKDWFPAKVHPELLKIRTKFNVIEAINVENK